MEVVLHKAVVNLNRAYRTCEFFGIKKIKLHECKGEITGNLFKSKGNVLIENINELPSDSKDVVFFETDGNIELSKVDLTKYKIFVFGGESNNILKKSRTNIVYIPRICRESVLTIENAMAIVLNQLIEQNKTKIKNFKYVDDNLLRSGLPTNNNLEFIKNTYGLDTVIDLSDRKRLQVENWCLKNKVSYLKFPINQDYPDIYIFKKAISAIKGKTLVHCYNGLHRTGVFCCLYEKKGFSEFINNYSTSHPELVKMIKNEYKNI